MKKFYVFKKRGKRSKSTTAPTSKDPVSPDRTHKLKAQPVPAFNNRFAAALSHFGTALLETSGIRHSGIKGSKREDTFRNFLIQRMPKRYGVASGEVVDQLNTAGPQLDALIFDQTRDFSFSDGDVQVLPAEALLASIEVKSKLSADEIEKCCNAARKLRALRPFKKPLGGTDVGRLTDQSNNHARYLHCVFAYDTDLTEATWMQSETERFRKNGCRSEHLIDAVYVLSRGLINLGHSRGRLEDEHGSALQVFIFQF